jgi:hypothetical protein
MQLPAREQPDPLSRDELVVLIRELSDPVEPRKALIASPELGKELLSRVQTSNLSPDKKGSQLLISPEKNHGLSSNRQRGLRLLVGYPVPTLQSLVERLANCPANLPNLKPRRPIRQHFTHTNELPRVTTMTVIQTQPNTNLITRKNMISSIPQRQMRH